MLNTRSLTDLFSQNSDERLCKRWYLVTCNGTLLANSQPTDVRELRKQVAMVIMSWQEQQAAVAQQPNEPDSSLDESDQPGRLQALTMEMDNANVIAYKLQPQLILVLEGGVPPRRPGFEAKVTAEGPDDDTYPADDVSAAGPNLGTSVSSKTPSTGTNAAVSVLRLQRKKLEAMANAIMDDFERTGFKMPDEASTRFF